ncbi:MAG: hypothetical protein ACRC5H_05815 [Treponemataceae bacterium]
MLILNPFFYYIFCSSALLIYGIGIKQGIDFSKNMSLSFWFYCLKIFVTSLITISLLWVISTNLLAPFGFADLVPIFIFFVVLFISKMIDIATTLLFSQSYPETFTSLLITFFALSESTTLPEGFLLIGAACFSLALFVPLLYTIIQKINKAKTPYYLKTSTLILISIAFILIAMYAWNLSWLNFEVVN